MRCLGFEVCERGSGVFGSEDDVDTASSSVGFGDDDDDGCGGDGGDVASAACDDAFRVASAG